MLQGVSTKCHSGWQFHHFKLCEIGPKILKVKDDKTSKIVIVQLASKILYLWCLLSCI